MWNRFIAGFFYLLAFIYAVYSMVLHAGPQEMVTDWLSREELYTGMGAGFALFALLTEMLASNEG